MGGVNSEYIFNFAMQMLCPIADGGVFPAGYHHISGCDMRYFYDMKTR